MKKILKLIVVAIVGLVSLSACNMHVLIMVGGSGDKDTSGKYIQKYHPAEEKNIKMALETFQEPLDSLY